MKREHAILGARGTWAVLALYVGLILFLATRSQAQTQDLFPHMDKVVHFIEYGILGYLSQRAVLRSWPPDWGGRASLRRGLVLACGVGIAVLDELLQSRVPNRVSSLWDLLADTAGLTAGLLLITRTGRSAPANGRRTT